MSDKQQIRNTKIAAKELIKTIETKIRIYQTQKRRVINTN